ncbi:MAG TPA: bifunctional phosphoribosylaminoimidazolecarboxamide formyltransferase/IMP cyclohydrolase [Firmicutes bacterium]|nr:bifunctional phosphoribosylaminoimidazolecarboxamide formyltransferase/IMP cyclohydrolase [Bacillota bacterium]
MGNLAVISVYDKQGVIEFARGLRDLGYQIVSTGGTAKVIRDAGVEVKEISDLTGFPEILDGRVKTLNPVVFAGILARRSKPEHVAQLEEKGIPLVDVVAVNLYPFEQTVKRPGATIEEAIENIDIGGPSLIRAAAKNHEDVIVICDPSDYEPVLDGLRSGTLGAQARRKLAAKAFYHTACYDSLIASYFARKSGVPQDDFPERFAVYFEKKYDLRYGENPHQKAAFYVEPFSTEVTIAGARQLQGKELSFNNILDADAALNVVREFDQPAAVAVKHTNPCGCAIGETIAEAFRKTYEGDPVSIFGGIVAFNRKLDAETARRLVELFLEIVIAPEYDDEALEILKRKPNLRVLVTGHWMGHSGQGRDFRRVRGGLLVQEADITDAAHWKVVTEKEPTPEQLADLHFAWKVVKHVKSNAIVLAKGRQTIGVGAGQMNRIDAARIAISHAGEAAKGCVLASDGFFPFADVVEAAADAGVVAIVQPGGSIRDEESIAKANERGVPMLLTGVRHFRH